MKNLNALKPIRIYNIDNILMTDNPEYTKTRNVVVINESLENAIDLITSNFFRKESIVSYFSETRITNPYNFKKLVISNRDAFKIIRTNTHIVNMPINIATLKTRNVYFNIEKEMSFIKNDTIHIKTNKQRAYEYLTFLNNKFKDIENLGYDNQQYFFIDFIPDDIKDEHSLINCIHLIFKFGIKGLPHISSNKREIRNLKKPVRLIFRNKSTKDTFYYDYDFGGTPLNVTELAFFDRSLKNLERIALNSIIEDNVGDEYFVYSGNEKITKRDLNNLIHYETEKDLVETAFINVNSPNKKDLNDKYKILKEAKIHLFKVSGDKIEEIQPFGVYFLNQDEIRLSIRNDLFNQIIGTINRNGSSSKSENEIYQDVMDSISNIVNDTEIKLNDKENAFDTSNIREKILKSKEIKDRLKEIDEQRVQRQKAIEGEVLYQKLANSNTKFNNLKNAVSQTANENLAKNVKIDTPFEEMKQSIADNMNFHYSQNHMKDDITNCFNNFGDPDSEPPIILSDIKIEDTSDAFFLKDTWEVSFNIPGRKPQTLKIDVPKVTIDGYLFTYGSKKTILKQIIAKPIIYIKSSGIDSVQFTTNYNKMFIEKTGSQVSPNFSRLIKLIRSEYNEKGKIFKYLVPGNAIGKNSNYRNTLEYNEFSKYFVKIDFSNGEVISFDRDKTNEILEEKGFSAKDYPGLNQNMVPLGFINGKLVLFAQDGNIYATKNTDTSKQINENDLISKRFYDFILGLFDNIDPTLRDKFKGTTVGKKFMYSRVKIIGRYIPLITVLGWKDGLDVVLDKYNVDYKLVESNLRSGVDIPSEYDSVIEFNDYKLYYDGSYRNNILLQGLNELSPREFNFSEFGKRGIAYQNYFIMINVSNLGRAINNFSGLFIDPITKEVLEELGQPSQFSEALLYCNTLLESTVTSHKNDMSNYRFRGAESIVSSLYKEIGNSIRQYRDSYKSGGQEKKLSIQQDKLMKVLLESPLIEEMVLMNPASEARNRIKSTYKGASGTNIKHAQGSQEIREYHQSMVGLLSPTSDDSSNVGVTRYLSVNPKIVSKRGFVVKTDLNELNASNLLSVVDILSPYSSQHADPPRFSMVGSQTRHTIPTLKMDPQLVITGAEKAIKYNVGTDYVFKAYLDGVVEEIDDKNQLVIIKYKDGTKAAIDLSVKTGRVSDGYFVTIQLSHNLKVGQKFKTDDILALDPQFFTTDSSDFNESSLKLGRLTRLIIAPQDITYEDSSIISKSLADDLASKVTFEKKIALSANINLINMKNIGDSVTTSENLVVYEELIDDESGTLSKIFDKMSTDVKNVIEEYNYSKVPSKYTGTIIDMRIYYNRDLSELSDSLRDMITKYQKKYLSKTNKLKEMRTDHVVFIPQIEKIESGKRVAGTEFDGVLVHYFIQTTDSFKVGDKITFDKALKSIVGAIYPDGMEPVTAGGDKIDACISPFSLASRMVMDVFMQGYSNKALLGLKEKIDEMLEEE